MNKLSEKELRTLISLSKRVLWSDADTRKRIQENKVNIVPANFYSDIPLLDDLENNFENKYVDGPYDLLIDDKKIEDFVATILEYSKEFDPPIEEPNKRQFFWKNPAFSFCDAMAYYSIVRKLKPKRILEIGSGYSTLVANEALIKNGSGEIVVIEPYPFDFLKKVPSVSKIIEKKVQDVGIDEFEQLMNPTDILFIDSTHTCKMGSDCMYIYLKLLPSIRKQILVHTHDVYLPWGMPTSMAKDKHIYWTEQYLLYAYLLNHSSCEVLFPSYYFSKKMEVLSQSFMHEKWPAGGASFWYKLNG